MEQQLRPSGLGEGGWPATQVVQLRGPHAPAQLPPPAPASCGGGGSLAAAGSVGQSQQQQQQQAAGGLALRYLPRNPNPANSNSAIHFLCQVGILGGWGLPGGVQDLEAASRCARCRLGGACMCVHMYVPVPATDITLARMINPAVGITQRHRTTPVPPPPRTVAEWIISVGGIRRYAKAQRDMCTVRAQPP